LLSGLAPLLEPVTSRITPLIAFPEADSILTLPDVKSGDSPDKIFILPPDEKDAAPPVTEKLAPLPLKLLPTVMEISPAFLRADDPVDMRKLPVF
jgi:hypothetical protein